MLELLKSEGKTAAGWSELLLVCVCAPGGFQHPLAHFALPILPQAFPEPAGVRGETL